MECRTHTEPKSSKIAPGRLTDGSFTRAARNDFEVSDFLFLTDAIFFVLLYFMPVFQSRNFARGYIYSLKCL